MTCEVGRWTCGHWTRWTRWTWLDVVGRCWPLLAVVELRTSDVECLKLRRWDVGTLGRWDVGTLRRRWDVGHWTLDIGRWTLNVGRWTVGCWEVGTLGTLDVRTFDVGRWDVIMRTVTNQAMVTHDHLCSPTNFVDNCSYIDFVIIGYVLNATIEWRVSEDD